MTVGRPALAGYPVNLIVAGRRCVVVGAGRIAARKIEALLAAGAEVARRRARARRRRSRAWRDAGRVDASPSAPFEPERSRRRLAGDDRHRRPRRQPGGLRGGRGTPGLGELGRRPRQLLVHAHVGRPPGRHRGRPSGTGGRSPALATWLKAHARRRRWAPSTRRCSTCSREAREEMRAEGRSTEDADWQRALDSGMLDLIRAGRVGEAKELLRSCLSSSSGSTTAPRRSSCSSGWRSRRAALPKALHALRGREHLAEVVLLSTCNRTEVYARCTTFHPAVAGHPATSSPTSRRCRPDELADHLYTYHDDAAVAHLFGVAAGLDSMIVGEGEILGQVREAWRSAEQRGRRPARCSSRVFRQAIEVGKRARTETAIGRHAVSVSSAAVALAGQTARSLEGRRVLVLGAGEVGEGMARRAGRAPASARSWSPTARRAARRRSPTASVAAPIALDELPDVLERSTCCSRRPRRDRGLASSAATSRRSWSGADGRALLVVDVAVPRDVDPGVGAGVRRDAPRHRRPARRFARAVAAAAAPARSAESGRSSPTSSSASASSARPARSRRSSAALRERGRGDPRRRARALRRPARRARPGDPRGGRGAHARASSTSCCTSPPSGSRTPPAPPAASCYADALAALFDLDGCPTTASRMTRAAAAASRPGAARSPAGRPDAGRRRCSACRRRAGDRRRPRGDRAPTSPIHALGGTGVFVKEVQDAVLDGRADVAVHSAKDLPAPDADRASCSPRSPSGAIRATRSSGARSTSCPTGGRVGTGSVRRRAQLAALPARPHLRRAARQHPDPPREGGASSTRSSSRPRRSTGSASPTGSPSASTRR